MSGPRRNSEKGRFVTETLAQLPVPALVLSARDKPLQWNDALSRLLDLPQDGDASTIPRASKSKLRRLVRAIAESERTDGEPSQVEISTPRGTLSLWTWIYEVSTQESGSVKLAVLADATRANSEHRQLLVYAEELRNLYHTVRRQYRQLTELHQASEAIQQALDLEHVVPLALQQLSLHYKCASALGLLLPKSRELHLFVLPDPQSSAKMTVTQVPPAQVTAIRRSLQIEGKGRRRSLRWLATMLQDAAGGTLEALELAAPFAVTMGRLGFVCLPERAARLDFEFLRAFTGQLSLAIGNAFLYEDLRRHADETDTLLESSRLLSRSLRVNHVLQTLSLLIGQHILQSEGVVAIGLPGHSGEMVLAGTVRHKDGTLEPLSQHWPRPAEGNVDGAFARADGTHDLRAVEDMASQNLFDGSGANTWRASLLAGKQRGELAVFTPRNKPLSMPNRRLLRALAGHARVALNHAVLFSRERAHAVSLANQQDRRTYYLQQMAHELKTPLTAIRPLLDILGSSTFTDGDPRKVEMIDIMDRGVGRLERLTDQYLQGLTAQGLPERPLSFEVTDLHTLISDVVELERPSFAQHDQTVSFRCTARETLALVDPLAIEEVVCNLFSNCHRHAGAGAEVLVTLEEKSGRWLSIAVSDQGRGISSGQIRRLRSIIDNPDAGRVGAPHMGLRICAQLVELHGGSIWIRSHQGKETTVGFSLPGG